MVLVALRLGIGWQFYKEGVEKIRKPGFSSAGFLSSAKGPLAPAFRWLAVSNPDPDGMARLDEKETLRAWKLYHERIVLHYQFDQRQQDLARRAYARRERQLKDFFNRNREDIETYFKGLERRAENRADVTRTEVASLNEQRQSIERDLRRDLTPWLATINRMWDDYSAELEAIATSQQRSVGALPLHRPAEQAWGSRFVNAVIPCFDLVVGVLLLLGLLTRPAALLAAVFLATVVASQWPGAEGASPVYYQFNLMLASLVLMATGAGRFAGLDYFLSRFVVQPLCRQCCSTNRRQEQPIADATAVEVG